MFEHTSHDSIKAVGLLHDATYDLIVAETAIEMRNFGLAPEDWPDDEEAEE